MKKLPLILLFATYVLLAQDPSLKLASNVWPPFTNIQSEKAFALDLVREALARMDIKAEFIITDFEDVLNGIDEGSFDGSAALWESEQRRNKYHFSEPYLQNRLILVGRKGTDVSAESVSQLTGKRLGLVKNYAYGSEIASSRVFVPVFGSSDKENLERLLKNEIDYMLVDALLLQFLFENQIKDVSDFLSIGEKPLIIRTLHLAIDRRVPDSRSIVSQFNHEISKMISDGTYNKILELNWIVADVNGDGQTELIMSGEHAGGQAPGPSYNVFVDTTRSNVDQTHNYYINGVLYTSWEEVPAHYKQKELKGDAYDANTAPRDYGLRLQF